MTFALAERATFDSDGADENGQTKHQEVLRAGLKPRCGDQHRRADWMATEILPHRKWLQRWVAQRFPREADIEDIVQESFERVLGVADPWAIQNPKSYLGRTAYTLVLCRLRRRKIVHIDFHEDLDGLGLECAWPLQDRQLEGCERLRCVEKALGTLPERTQQVIRLRRIEGISQRDTAQILGVSESAIEKHLSRAMRCALGALSEEEKHGERCSGPTLK